MHLAGALPVRHAQCLCHACTQRLVTLRASTGAPHESEIKIPQPLLHQRNRQPAREVLKQSPAKDIEKNLKAGLTSMLGKLDMVSREEFDVQTEVLARTREMLAQLEARLAELENSSAKNKWPSPSSRAGARRNARARGGGRGASGQRAAGVHFGRSARDRGEGGA